MRTVMPCPECGDERVRFERCVCDHLDLFHAEAGCATTGCRCVHLTVGYDSLTVHAHIAAAALAGAA